MSKNIAIIGSGSWGMALAIHLAKKGNNIKIWSFLEEEEKLINEKRKCKFLPDVERIPDNITATVSLEDCINNSDYIFHVTPSKFTRETINKYKQFITKQPIIICSKGFEEGTNLTLDEVVKEEIQNSEVAILSGPSHAEEVSIGVPTAMVLASNNNLILSEIQELLMNDKLRIYLSNDVKGVELGGTLKNIISFCAGILTSLNLGDNTMAALITRGLLEISRLGEALGGEKETFYGLSGLGDLIVTCSSKHSRNRHAGILIGQGKSIKEIKDEIGMTIESLDNIESAYKLKNIHNIEMPITETVYNILHENISAMQGVEYLMNREKKFENQ